jgi:serine/threonine protein kinase
VAKRLVEPFDPDSDAIGDTAGEPEAPSELRREDTIPGVARAASTVRTGHGTVLGTPAYMAPEQRRGESHTTGAPADVYALGALLHFLLVGRPPEPPRGDGQAQPRLRRIDPSVPAPLESICGRAMALSPEDRYASALDLAQDVGRFQAGERVFAHHEGWASRGARVVKRYRIPILVVLAYVVVRVLVLLVSGR